MSILDHVVALDRAHQDLKLYRRGNLSGVTPKTLEPFFRIYVKFHDFLIAFSLF